MIHGDYHGGNLMFKNGSLSGVLDWSFCISNPAVDLAHTMNDYLVFILQIGWGMSSHLWEQIMDGVLQAYQAIRPLNLEHIKACRVFHLFGALTAGLAGGGIEFMRKSESQRDYLSFIEQTTGIRLSPSASTSVEMRWQRREDGLRINRLPWLRRSPLTPPIGSSWPSMAWRPNRRWPLPPRWTGCAG